MSDRHLLDACRAARLPVAGLAMLAPLRAASGINVIVDELAWVWWEGNRPELTAALIAVPEAELFEPRDGRWYRPGERLPVFDVPPRGESVLLDRAVLPAAFVPSEPQQRELRRVPLRLVRNDAPRPASAIRCSLSVLRSWTDIATTADIVNVKAARLRDICWLLGRKLPTFVNAERFWGERVLIPLGFRADPDWSDPALREAAHVGPDELLVLFEGSTEALPAGAFQPLTRAAVRRA